VSAPPGEAPRRAAIVATPRFPWPLDDGGRIALWQTVWSATRAYDVTLVSFVASGAERDPLPGPVRDLGIEVVRIPHRPPASLVAAWRGLVGRWPYTLARYRDPAFERALSRVAETRRPAFALLNNLHLATYLKTLAPIPVVLRPQNVEHRWMARYAQSRGLSAVGWYAGLQAARLRRAEAELCGRAALVLAIQEGEAELLRSLAPGARVETLPVGIDLERFGSPATPAPPAIPTPENPPIVLLAGSFAWPPNAEGARRFLIESWPRVAAAEPRARLRLAGKDPPPALAAAARRAGAELAGSVDSMPAEFARATLLVVPLWVGAGARVKIVEALAARLPVVGTPLAAEGLGLKDGADYLEGATPTDLAERIVDLLRSPERRASLARAGRSVAEARWSLPAVAAVQNALCASVAR
jgi:glycosyltransferase involved in cell wall biosynthesis